MAAGQAERLDALVTEYLQTAPQASRRVLRPPPEPAWKPPCLAPAPAPPSTPLSPRTPLIAQQGAPASEELRGLLLAGDFPGAADRLAAACPKLSGNAWLQFQLKKHHFAYLATSSGDGPDDPAGRARRVQQALGAGRRGGWLRGRLAAVERVPFSCPSPASGLLIHFS